MHGYSEFWSLKFSPTHYQYTCQYHFLFLKEQSKQTKEMRPLSATCMCKSVDQPSETGVASQEL